jgi:hypothetical protein
VASYTHLLVDQVDPISLRLTLINALDAHGATVLPFRGPCPRTGKESFVRGVRRTTTWKGHMRQPLPVLLHGFRFAAVFAGALCFVLTGLSGASRAQDNPQRVFQQFFEIMREIQREAQRKKANREGDDSRQTSGTPAAGVRYKVAGMELGQNVDLAEARSRGFTCGPSDTYPLHSRCSMTERNREGRGEYSATSSFLVSPEGRALYVNQSIAPAFWTAGEAKDDIASISRQYREQPRTQFMPAREGLPLGTIAVWGNVTLEPLDEDSLQRLAVTGEAHKGYLVDFENNFSVSAISAPTLFSAKSNGPDVDKQSKVEG